MQKSRTRPNGSSVITKPKCYQSSPSVSNPLFLEFFAGSGLVTHALKTYFGVAWANDICEKKAAVYTANHGSEKFHLGSIENVRGVDLPAATMSWASFPCQDLSLAGLAAGIHAKRSGLVWQWLRIMDEMPRRVPILVAENVLGLISSNGGSHYHTLHEALRSRGYSVGAVVLNAAEWVPQSRPRVFVIALHNNFKAPQSLVLEGPSWHHPVSLCRAMVGLKNWIWWNLPRPTKRSRSLADIIEWDVACDDRLTANRNLRLVPPHHIQRMRDERISVAPGYKRTRAVGQVLELRFDGIAGCLRTPEGGSSRQFLVIRDGDEFKSRLLTVRETARLMGAPDSYKLPGGYNDGYKAMGDAVAAPVARHLARYLLAPLAKVVNV